MDSRSAMTSNGVIFPLDHEWIAQQASKELSQPRAQPEPVGQNGFIHIQIQIHFQVNILIHSFIIVIIINKKIISPLLIIITINKKNRLIIINY